VIRGGGDSSSSTKEKVWPSLEIIEKKKLREKSRTTKGGFIERQLHRIQGKGEPDPKGTGPSPQNDLLQTSKKGKNWRRLGALEKKKKLKEFKLLRKGGI